MNGGISDHQVEAQQLALYDVAEVLVPEGGILLLRLGLPHDELLCTHVALVLLGLQVLRPLFANRLHREDVFGLLFGHQVRSEGALLHLCLCPLHLARHLGLGPRGEPSLGDAYLSASLCVMLPCTL